MPEWPLTEHDPLIFNAQDLLREDRISWSFDASNGIRRRPPSSACPGHRPGVWRYAGGMQLLDPACSRPCCVSCCWPSLFRRVSDDRAVYLRSWVPVPYAHLKGVTAACTCAMRPCTGAAPPKTSCSDSHDSCSSEIQAIIPIRCSASPAAPGASAGRRIGRCSRRHGRTTLRSSSRRGP